jgi:ParB/RepB/Spo0J family partition protein
MSSQTMRVVMLAVAMLQPDPQNPRKTTDGGTLRELAFDIKRRGVLIPILCRRTGDVCMIIDGHRRHAAAPLAGLKEVPCIVFGEEVTEAQVREVQLVTSLQSVALSSHQTYLGMRNWLDLHPGASGKELSQAISRSESYVSMVLSLDKLIQPLKDLAAQGKLSIKQWYALSKLSPEAQAAKLNGHQPDEHETVKVTRISTPVPGKKAKLTITGKDISLASAIEIAQEFVRLAKVAAADGVSAKVFEGVCKDKAKAK